MTTQNSQSCLSAELLRRLSHDELSPAELKEVEEHVSDCERCRQLLEVPQSDPQWRDEIVPILRTPLESPHAAGDHDERGGEGESLESILRLLGPTDDPHMLGRIGSYEVVGVIGRGGMGVVFKAYEGALNRFVAIKMLLPHLASFGAARKRFAREGQAAAAVVNDYVLPIYAVAEWKGVPYLVTQYSRGMTLQTRVHSEGPLELKEILRLGMQTARGLAAAHAQGLVHRDVKPSNILLDGSVERALLTDFGLARAVDDASITRTGVIAGTPQYMSPEQARGGSVDARSDLFSLGCVLYFLCTGHPPFRADNSYAILRLITDEEPRSIREINPGIPDWLCSVVQKLMAKQPEDRYASASEVAEQLEACLAHVNNPLKNSLPAIVPRTLRLFPRNAVMTDTRKLSFVSFGLFIAALVLPWPIAAIGPDEYALIFAGVSMHLALTLAVVSRRELFSRIVLVGVATVLLLLMVVSLFSVRLNSAVPSNGARNVSAYEQATAISQNEARLQKIVEDNPIVVRVKLETGSFTGAMNLHRVIVQEVYKGKADDVQAVFTHFTGEDLPLPVRAEPDKPRMPTLKPGEYVLVLEAKPVTHSSAISSLGVRITPEESFNYIIARDSDRHAAWPVGSPEAEQVLALCGRESAGRNVDHP